MQFHSKFLYYNQFEVIDNLSDGFIQSLRGIREVVDTQITVGLNLTFIRVKYIENDFIHVGVI